MDSYVGFILWDRSCIYASEIPQKKRHFCARDDCKAYRAHEHTLEGTKTYGTFLSSHSRGRCSRISNGSASAAMTMNSEMPRLRVLVAAEHGRWDTYKSRWYILVGVFISWLLGHLISARRALNLNLHKWSHATSK